MAIGLRKATALSLFAGSLLVMLGPSGAALGENSAQPRYSRLTVKATFKVVVGYPDEADSHYNGFYMRLIQYELRAIVAYDGRRISAPGGNAIVGGRSVVQDARTQIESFVPPPSQRRRVPACPGWEDSRQRFTGPDSRWRFKSAPTASVLVDRGRLHVRPGAPIKWDLGGCGEGNSGDHGLHWFGPSFNFAAPASARFRGTKRFVVSCKDSFSHDFEHPVHGHSFSGLVFFRVTFVPFASDKLGPNKTGLRSAVGKQDGGSLGQDPPPDANECL